MVGHLRHEEGESINSHNDQVEIGELDSSPNRATGYKNHFAMKYRNTYCVLNTS